MAQPPEAFERRVIRPFENASNRCEPARERAGVNAPRVVLTALIVFGPIGTVHAELTSVEDVTREAVASPAPLTEAVACPTAPTDADAQLDLWLTPTPPIGIKVQVPHDPTDLKTPALPGSASLFLSGVFSLGGWHLLRRPGSIRFAYVPDWYHAAAPERIGHAVVVDLAADMNVMPICLWEVPQGDERESKPALSSHDSSARMTSQDDPSPARPRGPPLFVRSS
jgi:hypothetical protein